MLGLRVRNDVWRGSYETRTSTTFERTKNKSLYTSIMALCILGINMLTRQSFKLITFWHRERCGIPLRCFYMRRMYYPPPNAKTSATDWRFQMSVPS
jgi:hypothetical protein